MELLLLLLPQLVVQAEGLCVALLQCVACLHPLTGLPLKGHQAEAVRLELRLEGSKSGEGCAPVAGARTGV